MRKISVSVLALIALLAIVGAVTPVFARSVDAFSAMAQPDVILLTRHGTLKPSVAGFTPAQFRKAYGIDRLSQQGAGMTVAIIDACGNTHAQADLNTYDTQFGLPAITIKIVTPQGPPCSQPNTWGLETDLDLQMVHAVAPQASIVLEEAQSPSNANLLNAAKDAYTHQGATVVSMSFGGREFSGETGSHGDAIFSAGNARGVSFTASSGDSGCGSQYPAASPFVTSVGGTVLTTQPDGTYVSETAWSSSGGGFSSIEARPAYQKGFNKNAQRGIPDVSLVSTNMSMYDSQFGGFVEVNGTSIGAPMWAGILTDANSGRGGTFKNADIELYAIAKNKAKYASDYHDITTGGSGGVCNAKQGYDEVTGLGTAVANHLVPDLIAAP